MVFFPKMNTEGSRCLQYIATLTAALSALSAGVNQGWSSPYLPVLLHENSTIPTTPDVGSWIAVMTFLGAPPGAITAALTVDIIGRKMVILSLAPITFSCFIWLAYAGDVMTICIIRFIIASVEGALYTVLPIYFAEIAEPKIRGFLGMAISIAACLGVILINIIGSLYSIYLTSYICAVIPIIHVITFVFMPESPYYYCKKLDYSRARDALERLRGTTNVDEEMKEISAAVKRQESEAKDKVTDLFTVPSNRKAVYIYTILSCTNKATGKSPITGYTMMIFDMAKTGVDSTLSVIIFSIVGLFGTLGSSLAIDRLGRRPMMIASSLGSCISIFGMAIYFTILFYSPELALCITFLPLACLIFYNFIFSCGLTFGPVFYLSELFPTTAKAKALCMADIFAMALGTITSKFFQWLMDSVGVHVPFWTFAFLSIIGVVMICKFVPETKGKTLEEIQFELIRQSKKKDEMIVDKIEKV